MEKKRYSFGNKLLLTLASLGVALVLCEILLRMFGYHYSPMSIKVEGVSPDCRFAHSFGDENFEYDPKLIWRPRRDHSVFNAQGFRGALLLSPKRAGEFRIVAIGDSNTLGWANGGSNWPKQLDQLVREKDEDFKVTNAGVWGYSSFQGLGRFKEVLDFQPDMVLISFGANDAHRVRVPDAQFATPLFQSPLFATRTGQLVVAVWHRITAGAPDAQQEKPVPRVSLQEYRDNLSEIVRISQEHGIRCVLLTRPFQGRSPHKTYWKYHAPTYVDATLEVARRYDVPLVDIHEHFDGKTKYFADESHFNADGHRHAAELIYEAIQPLLPPADP